MGTKTKIFITAVVSAAVTAVITAKAASFLNGYSALWKSGSASSKLETVSRVLENGYLYDFDKEKLTEDAIKGYVEGLDEPYTHYYTAKEFSDYIGNIQDDYVGIGVVVSVNNSNEVEVVSTFEDSPAYKAGILPEDVITKVDGTAFSGDEMNELVSKIKSGTEGTLVKLTIKRNGTEQEFEVKRSGIKTKSVNGEMLEGNIALVRISAFNTSGDDNKYNTYTEFRDTVSELQKQGMNKMIIDLRDNPGGDLEVVCDIADMLLPEGTITYMEYKNGKRDTYSSDKESLGIPMAVLINGNSASASEVLTGALKDYGAAKIVGTKSYGKGIVQSVFPFADGSGLSMTIANYYSPNGVCIHGVGIEPDYEVKMPEEYSSYYASTVPHSDDVQLKKAIELLK